MERSNSLKRSNTLKQTIALFSQVGTFATNQTTLLKYQSYKDFKRHLEKPLLNYQSDHVKDILNYKSLQYNSPNAKPAPLSHKRTLEDAKVTLSPLKYPSLLPEIIEDLD